MAFDANLKDLLSDVFGDEIKETKLCPDMQGKVILISGGNNLGKSYQASKFPNPIFMPFENGLNAISGAMVLNSATWSDFKKNVRKLIKNKKLREVLKTQPITIILDNIKNSGIACQKYLEERYDIQDISEGFENNGKNTNLYPFYAKEYWNTISSLFNVGFTVVAISHEEEEMKNGKPTGKMIPDRDKRSVGVFKDNADITIHLESNGVDENGNTIPSSGYMYETDDFFGRTRYRYMNTYLEEFSADNLINAIREGILKQIKIEGGEAVTFDKQNEVYQNEGYTKDELVDMIKQLFSKMEVLGDEAVDKFDSIVDENLGGKTIGEATENQIQPLITIKSEIEEYLDEYAPF